MSLLYLSSRDNNSRFLVHVQKKREMILCVSLCVYLCVSVCFPQIEWQVRDVKDPKFGPPGSPHLLHEQHPALWVHEVKCTQRKNTFVKIEKGLLNNFKKEYHYAIQSLLHRGKVIKKLTFCLIYLIPDIGRHTFL